MACCSRDTHNLVQCRFGSIHPGNLQPLANVEFIAHHHKHCSLHMLSSAMEMSLWLLAQTFVRELTEIRMRRLSLMNRLLHSTSLPGDRAESRR